MALKRGDGAVPFSLMRLAVYKWTNPITTASQALRRGALIQRIDVEYSGILTPLAKNYFKISVEKIDVDLI
jgi:hypothetical protein